MSLGNHGHQPPTILTVGGSDSGGAAGIQADLKTATMLGVYGMSVVTAVTAQNSVSVMGVYPVPSSFVGQQLEAVLSDYGTQGLKTGFLGRKNLIKVIAGKLSKFDLKNVVIDPVLVNHRGESMFSEEVTQAYIDYLLPLADLVTPNVQEAKLLSGVNGDSIEAVEEAAGILAKLGGTCVLVTAVRDGQESADIYHDGDRPYEFRSPWIDTPNRHGSGDTLSTAVCAFLVRGLPLMEAVEAARRFTHRAIQGGASWRLGEGHGPVSCWGTGIRDQGQ